MRLKLLLFNLFFVPHYLIYLIVEFMVLKTANAATYSEEQVSAVTIPGDDYFWLLLGFENPLSTEYITKVEVQMYLTHSWDAEYFFVYFTDIPLFYNAPGDIVGASDDYAIFSSDSSNQFKNNAAGKMNT